MVLLHNPAEQTLAADEVSGVLAELVSEGKVGAWGVSAGSAAVARAALGRGAQVLEPELLREHLRSELELMLASYASLEGAIAKRK